MIFYTYYELGTRKQIQAELDFLHGHPLFKPDNIIREIVDMGDCDCCLYGQALGGTYSPEANQFKSVNNLFQNTWDTPMERWAALTIKSGYNEVVQQAVDYVLGLWDSFTVPPFEVRSI